MQKFRKVFKVQMKNTWQKYKHCTMMGEKLYSSEIAAQ
jgi:hypothetical protein